VKRRLVLAVALAALVVAPSASAQGPVVQAIDGTPGDNFNFRWTPPDVTIRAGETVTWSFAGTEAPHNVASRGTNWSFPGGQPVRQPPPASFTFATPGVYQYVCEVHLPSMAGTVTVTDASGTPPSPPPPPPPSEQHWPNDQQRPPELEAGDETRVRFRLSERARVSVRFKLAAITVKTARRTFRAGRRSLVVRDPRMRGRYRVEVFARDLAGNRSRIKSAAVTLR
jgi:plastocyanin